MTQQVQFPGGITGKVLNTFCSRISRTILARTKLRRQEKSVKFKRLTCWLRNLSWQTAASIDHIRTADHIAGRQGHAHAYFGLFVGRTRVYLVLIHHSSLNKGVREGKRESKTLIRTTFECFRPNKRANSRRERVYWRVESSQKEKSKCCCCCCGLHCVVGDDGDGQE